jgi:predicted nuclease of predicted toxin-antitoxin system
MRFLIDNALSPEVAEGLQAAGHDAVHVQTRGLHEAPDHIVFQTARVEEQVLVSADTDFGAVLVPGRHTRPSLILFRHGSPRRPSEHTKTLTENLPTFSEDLTRGAIVVFRRNKIRIRKLSEQG